MFCLDTLFETQTVPQIEETLRQTRNDIEKKKEDLRVMVGERYRDLIEAADTIKDMEESSKLICEHIGTVETLCSSLQQRGLIGFKTHQPKLVTSDFRVGIKGELYSTAVQVKILVVVPEILWSLTEKEEYLSAAQLYLFAQQTYTVLRLSPQASKVLKSFPVIERQWSSISQFSPTIIRGCSTLISSDNHNVQNILEATVTMMLLEGCNCYDALDRILKLRKEAIKSCLISKPSLTSKVQISNFVNLLITTINCIRSIFTSEGNTPCDLEKRAREVTTDDGSNKIQGPVQLLHESSLTLSFLPSSLLQYRPKIKDMKSLPKDYIKDTLCSWLDSVLENAKDSLAILFSYTKSLKSLSMIRTCVLDIISERLKNTSNTNSVIKDVDPWTCVIREQMMDRAKTIIGDQLKDTSSSLLELLNKLLEEMKLDSKTCAEEGDITNFVWSESLTDLPDKVGWSPASARLPVDSGGLYFKTRGYTVRVQNICLAVNVKLHALVQDLEYLAPDAEQQNFTYNENVQNFIPEDYKILLQFLQDDTQRLFILLIKDLEAKVTIKEGDLIEPKEVDPWDEEKGGTLTFQATSLVVGARVCHALTNICPQLQICSSATLLTQTDISRRMALGVKVDTKSWKTVSDGLLESNTRLMTLFISSLTKTLSGEMTNQISSMTLSESTEKTLALYPSWESVTIEEEKESGEKVKCSIYVPAQPSPVLIHTLTKLCSAINCIALHTVTRSVQVELIQLVGYKMIAVYESFDSSSLSQSIALQLAFDTKFIQTLLIARKDKDLCGRAINLVEKFESIVDPFDLDVFSPHIMANVRAAVHRLQVLLGILIPKDRQVIPKQNISSASTTNNTLPLIPVMDIPRFANVPLPVSTSISSRLQNITNSTLTNTAPQMKLISNEKKYELSSKHNKDMSSAAIAASRSAASLFSAAMSSSWFGSSQSS